MKVLENQTLYQCSFCNKRLLSKAGAKIHEKEYCIKVRELKKEKLQAICPHDETDTHYELMAGEDYAMEPAYEYCINCGKIV